MKTENLVYTMIICSIISIFIYISSCLCSAGDTACLRGCDIRIIVGMLTGVIAVTLFVICAYKIIKTKGGKPKWKKE